MAANCLRDRLHTLDRQSYGAYKSLRGCHPFANFMLHIDYVQGDPFAVPSRVRIEVQQAIAQFPGKLYAATPRRIALEDYLIRQFERQIQTVACSTGSGKSGLIEIVRPSQVILPRTAARVSDQAVELRFAVGLPAFGRRIAGRQAADLLCNKLPRLIGQTLFYAHLDGAALQTHCDCAEAAEYLRRQLRDRRLVAFVADGAVLPRQSGVDDRPLSKGTVPFKSPPSLRVSLSLPDGQAVTGLGIPPGVTLIVGGGYHGKSTLLRAIAAGIYNHIPGDGRERGVTDAAAMKVRAEDGRSVVGVNISPFINHLPQGRSTVQFSTQEASGSTSQAASIVEAVEAGATTLLIDEDTSATNFMIRDRRMQALIAKEQEPITPFVDKVRQLHTDYGVSTVLVMGGSGDYFDVADTVIALDNYCPADVTESAKSIALAYQTERQAEGGMAFGDVASRVIAPQSIDARKGKRAVNMKTRTTDEIRLGIHEIDLSAVEQLVEPGQLKAIAAAMVYAQQYYFDGQRSLVTALDEVMNDIAEQGLDCLSDRLTGEFVNFRALEIAAALNRLRTLVINGTSDGH